MTSRAFLLVLISVFLHAGWNFLSKRARPSLAFYSLASTSSCLVLLPVFCWLWPRSGKLPPSFWMLWPLSVVSQFVYFFGLTNAYRRSDISLVYPLARAIPVLLTALITALLGLGQKLSLPTLTGMAVLCLGCLLMPLEKWRDFGFASYRNRVIFFILLAAVGITGFTVLDSEIVKHLAGADGGTLGRVGRALMYLFMIEAGLATALYIAVALNPAERQNFRNLFLKTPIPSISGLSSSCSYVLILLAMGLVSNVSYVQAFRQMSLPLGVLLGVLFLHERPAAPRLTGIALVVAGLVLAALG